jgi:coenzyme PQQ precursor peptide PqqA
MPLETAAFFSSSPAQPMRCRHAALFHYCKAGCSSLTQFRSRNKASPRNTGLNLAACPCRQGGLWPCALRGTEVASSPTIAGLVPTHRPSPCNRPTHATYFLRRAIMTWSKPEFIDWRFGFEITLYIANR